MIFKKPERPVMFISGALISAISAWFALEANTMHFDVAPGHETSHFVALQILNFICLGGIGTGSYLMAKSHNKK